MNSLFEFFNLPLVFAPSRITKHIAGPEPAVTLPCFTLGKALGDGWVMIIARQANQYPPEYFVFFRGGKLKTVPFLSFNINIALWKPHSLSFIAYEPA
jgi:hypothetical protein